MPANAPANDLFEQIRIAFADAVPDRSSARLLAADIGLNLASLDLDGSALVFWQVIIDAARGQGLLDALFAKVIALAPAITELPKLRADYAAWRMAGGQEPATPETILTPLHRAYLERLSEQKWATVSMSLFKTSLARREKLTEIYTPLSIGPTRIRVVIHDNATREMKMDSQQTNSLLIHKIKLRLFDALALSGRRERVRWEQENTWGVVTWGEDAEHAVSVQRRFVLTGDPGSGKSSFLRHLALTWAAELLGGKEKGQAAYLPRPALTPIYIELRSLVAQGFPALAADSSHRPALPGLSEFREYLRQHLLKPTPASKDGDALDDLLFNLLRAGKAAILLDGLDEVNQAADPHRQAQVEAFVGALAEEFKDAPIIVTSRSYAYRPGGWSLPGFGRTTLVPLDRARQLKMADKLFARLSPGLPDRGLETFAADLDRIPDDLASNPLLLTLLVALWLDLKKPDAGSLPSTRGELYRRALALLLEDLINEKTGKFSLKESPVNMDVDELRFVLQLMACYAHERRTEPNELPVITDGDIYTALRQIGRGKIADDLLEHLERQAGMLLDLVDEAPSVLVAPGAKVFRFLHLSFQEYLAACEMLYRRDAARPFGLPVPENREFPSGLAEYVRKQPELWANVLRLAVDQLVATRRPLDAWELLHECCEPYRRTGEAPQAAVLALQVALETAADLFNQPRDARHAGFYQHLVEAAEKALTDHETYSLEQRFIAGKLLGGGPFPGHDARKGVGLRPDGLPDIAWQPAPEADPATGRREFIYGDGERRIEPDFWIARYPVTYAQFEAFIKASDGFHNPEWWQGLSADEGDRKSPGTQAFEFWNHPRERVSWYDAVAFCRWLSAQARAHRDLLPEPLRGQDDWRISLPTEWQWEKAARGHDGRAYPWGPEHESGRANIYEGRSNRAVAEPVRLEHESGPANIYEIYRASGTHYPQSTSAVGMYPRGASPCGAQDMSGNVWEWCLNSYADPAYCEMKGNIRRVLRGGSWNGITADAAARARFEDRPILRLNCIGFRVVVGVPGR